MILGVTTRFCLGKIWISKLVFSEYDSRFMVLFKMIGTLNWSEIPMSRVKNWTAQFIRDQSQLQSDSHYIALKVKEPWLSVLKLLVKDS